MANHDLLPEPYRQALSSRRALRVWSVAAAVCGLVCVGAVVSSATRGVPAESAAVAEQIAVAERRSAQSQARAGVLGEQLALHRRAASAVDAVADQPDWRLLLEYITLELNEEVVLTGCELGTKSRLQLQQGTSQSDPGTVWLVLSGVAGDYAQVPALVLKLEAMGLFGQVQLVETRRQSFVNESRIGFRIACQVQ